MSDATASSFPDAKSVVEKFDKIEALIDSSEDIAAMEQQLTDAIRSFNEFDSATRKLLATTWGRMHDLRCKLSSKLNDIAKAKILASSPSSS